MSVFSLSNIIQLIEKANDHEVGISFSGDELSVHVQKGKQIDKALLDELKSNKPLLIHYFKNFANREKKNNIPAINKIDRNQVNSFPLSFSQERLWFIHQLEGSLQYHLPIVLRLKGKLDVKILIHAIQNIINRHDVLRTVILEEDGRGYQHIKSKDEWSLSIVDDSGYNKDETESFQQLIRQLVNEPFNLSKDYMLRAHLININAEEHVLVITMHHIASDAWSQSVLVKEVLEFYAAYLESRPEKLSPLEIQYADYASWQRSYLHGEIFNSKIEYWKNKLQGVGMLQLPTDFVRPSLQSYKGNNVYFNLEKKLSDHLRNLSQQQGVTLFITLLSAYKVMLYRYSGQQDICVGTSFARREQHELESLIGFFVNTLALRDEIVPDVSFIELLQHVKTTTIGAYENQDIPFEKIVETVVKERDPGRNPLFQVMLVFANTPEVSELKLAHLEVLREQYEQNTTKFDITFFITETPNGLQGSVQYRTDLYKKETIEEMVMHFRQLLYSIVHSPQEKVGSLAMLNEYEKEQLIVNFNNSAVEYSKDKSIIDLFELQVIATPENTALIFGGQQLSYKELNERSNQLANYLRSRGIKEEMLVPVYLTRGLEMIVAILGIMKAGAAYVPIDTDYPGERINHILEDTGALILIGNRDSTTKIEKSYSIEIVEIDGDWSSISGYDSENLLDTSKPEQLAYVIYTSGSTGRPKGVMIEHRNLVDYYSGLVQQVHVDKCESFGLVSTLATDLGNTVIYSSLLSGGALHIFSKESASNIEFLHTYFNQHRIDCLKIVPSHWNALSMDAALLLPEKLLIFGGEALPIVYIDSIRLSGSHCKVVNHYGPTETTIGKLLHEVKDTTTYQNTIPIGRPFSNTNVYVLNPDLQLCPVGVPGQLYIAGDGIARGYWNNEELTKERFIKDSFASRESDISKWMYATGDLVKWLPGGDLSFIGRVDDQVKIRGYRVELGEIESILQQSEFVNQAVVIAREDKRGNRSLIAYIVPQEEFDMDAVIAYLKDRLPEYMVPGFFMEIEGLPLTANGKIDRKSLPDPDAEGLVSAQFVAPRNETEIKLAAVWQDVLELDQVGVHDDFFELGGHSLLAVRLISAIRKEFIVEMPISDIFDFPTVALLSGQVVKNSGTIVLPSIKPVHPRPEHIPLSFSQERLWFIDLLEGSVQYHVPAVIRLKGKLNINALNYALQSIVNRHEVLRSVIREEEGHAYQYVKEPGGWELSIVDSSVYEDDNKSLQQYLQQLISEPFDLSNDDMFRATLITSNEEEYILVGILHHIASDGWSRSILVKELVELYNTYDEGRMAQFPPLKVQYADFAIWQRANLNGEVFDQKLGYWKKKLEDVTSLQLRADYKRPPIWSTQGASAEFNIDKNLSRQLLELSQKQGVTLFMTLLAAFKVLLHRYSGQSDICVGTPIAGRQQIEVEELIGFFVNTLALRSEVQSEYTFKELLHQVRSTTMEAYENQEIPFEKVVDSLMLERDISRNPLFQVMFVLRNTPEIPVLMLGDVVLSGQGYEHTSTLFDITLFVTETEHGLHCRVEYSTSLYAEQTIMGMMSHFKQLLFSIVQAPDIKIGSLPMLSKPEEHQLLVDFNDSQASYPDNKSIIALFEDQVEKTPEAIAVVFEEEQLSYKELNQRANQLARYLTTRGIKEKMLVPICVRRSLEMIVGILGILKSGAAFVPVDPEYPVDRINYMLADTGAKIIISTEESKIKLLQVKDLDIIHLDTDWSLINRQHVNNVQVDVSPNHLAYVIHTSGSTGMPKGVMIEHGGVVNLLKSIDRTVNFSSKAAFLSVTTFSFDICYLEFFIPLINGGNLIIVPREIAIDGFRLAESISFYKPTHMQATPVTWQLLLDAGWENMEGIKILIGGEAIKEEIKDALTKVGEVYNLYGPTETTIWSVCKKLATHEKVLIGKPIANTSVYILGELMQLVPVGVAGEICIGGAGLARGYLNRPDLTDQKFISNPFSNTPGSRIYKTGDMGRWLPDGNLECLGRIDDQVKIRGYRIELGEIESILMQSELVNQAVVIAKEDKENNKKLIGYYIPKWQAVKAKELELYERHLESWKEIYETEYALGNPSVDEEFDINIWKNSFTGEPIGETQMQEWLQDIVAVILSEKTRNVMEIGCGTGLIYYRLAGKVNKYIGTDFSNSCINQITQRIKKGRRDYGPTRLKVCAAHEISLEAEEQVDTIIMNSIVQYFPGEEYMNEVMGKCLSILKNSGRIIIGDVRDNRLLELFKGRLQIQNMAHSVNIREFKWAVEQAVLKEEELCFSPEYFYRLKSIYPDISQIEIRWKDALNTNELTLYRYTVVIHVGAATELLEPDWQNLKEPEDKEIVKKQLEESESIIALKNVPNFRLWQERLLSKALSEKSVNNVGDLLPINSKEDEESLEIENIIRLAKAKGYHIHLLLNEDPLKIDVVMELYCSGRAIQKPYVETDYGDDILYTNIPLFSDISLLLQNDLKSLLIQRLPEYMVPSELVALSQLPLTNNGKVDRRFLSLREEKAVSNNLNYKGPSTEIEQMLAGIWQELLGVGRIGIYDNFFELGGHSLLAMRVISAIRKELDVELAIKDLFQFTTISELSRYLEIQLNIYSEGNDSTEFDLVYI